MEFDSDMQVNIEIQVESEDNIDIAKDKMSKVNNRIDNAITALNKQRHEWIHDEMTKRISTLEENASKDADEIIKLKKGNFFLDSIINEKKDEITSLKLSIKHWLRRYEQVQIDKMELDEKCSHLQEALAKSEKELDEAQKEITTLREEVKSLKTKRDSKHIEHEPNIAQENFVSVICTLSNVIGTMSKELLEEKIEKERFMKGLEKKKIEVEKLTQKMEAITRDLEEWKVTREHQTSLKSPAEEFVSQEKPCAFLVGERELRQNDVDNTSDYSQSSKSSKMLTESNFQQIIRFKNMTIDTLHRNLITQESFMAELENKLLDVRKKLEGSMRNHLSSVEVKRSPVGDW